MTNKKPSLVKKLYHRGEIYSCFYEQNINIVNKSIIGANQSSFSFNASDFLMNYEAQDINSSLEEVFVAQPMHRQFSKKRKAT